MGKYIQKVADVIEKAKRNGSASSAPYSATYDEEGQLILRHYGTIIFVEKQGRVIQLGGYSKSDADAIGTAMVATNHKLGVTRSESSAKANARIGRDVTNMGGWYVVSLT